MTELLIGTCDDPDLACRMRLAFQVEMTGPLGEEGEKRFLQANREHFVRGFADGSVVFYLARVGGEVAGCVVLQEQWMTPNRLVPSGRTGLVLNMHVLDGFRRRGVGEALMREVEAEAKRRGMDRLDLKATAMGEPLYRKFGFDTPRGGKPLERYL
jgi:GNAT superfamily N-acetyltransferase